MSYQTIGGDDPTPREYDAPAYGHASAVPAAGGADPLSYAMPPSVAAASPFPAGSPVGAGAVDGGGGGGPSTFSDRAAAAASTALTSLSAVTTAEPLDASNGLPLSTRATLALAATRPWVADFLNPALFSLPSGAEEARVRLSVNVRAYVYNYLVVGVALLGAVALGHLGALFLLAVVAAGGWWLFAMAEEEVMVGGLSIRRGGKAALLGKEGVLLCHREAKVNGLAFGAVRGAVVIAGFCNLYRGVRLHDRAALDLQVRLVQLLLLEWHAVAHIPSPPCSLTRLRMLFGSYWSACPTARFCELLVYWTLMTKKKRCQPNSSRNSLYTNAQLYTYSQHGTVASRRPQERGREACQEAGGATLPTQANTPGNQCVQRNILSRAPLTPVKGATGSRATVIT